MHLMSPPALNFHKPASARNSETQISSILRLVTFFLFLLISIYAMHFLINGGLRSIMTSSYGVTNLIVNGGANADIVISGSSRALTHYDTRVLSAVTGLSSFNIGRNGSQTDMQLAFLLTYLKHNKPPKLVLHNLDLFSFVTSEEIYDPAQYLPYLGEADLLRRIKQIYPNAWKWKHLPLYGYVVEDLRLNWVRGLAAVVGIQPEEDHFNGYLPRRSKWTGDFELFRQSNPDGVKFKIEAGGIAALSELAKTCKDRGVPLLFVYSPVYWEMQQLERNRKEVFDRFYDICKQYDILLWDYSTSSLCRDRSNFYNSQHLNEEGATKFSQELAHKILTVNPYGVLNSGTSPVN